MDYRKAKHFLEMVEIPVPMQKRVPVPKTERRDYTIYGLTNRVPPLTESSEVPGSLDGQFLAAGRQELELSKATQNLNEGLLVSDALKDLAENQIGQPKALASKLTIKVIGLLVSHTTEIVNPNGGIDDHHRSLLRKPAATGLMEVPDPSYLASKPTYGSLPACLNQQLQPSLNRSPFGPGPAAPHRLPYQAVVNINVRSHLLASDV